MSFWAAFVISNNESVSNKTKWLMIGLAMLWAINVLRITFLLMANNKHWPIPFFDHHTWFNLLAYGLIFLLMWMYDKHHKTIKNHLIQPAATAN
jgi:exosortase/archaeosortase family protein